MWGISAAAAGDVLSAAFAWSGCGRRRWWRKVTGFVEVGWQAADAHNVVVLIDDAQGLFVGSVNGHALQCVTTERTSGLLVDAATKYVDKDQTHAMPRPALTHDVGNTEAIRDIGARAQEVSGDVRID